MSGELDFIVFWAYLEHKTGCSYAVLLLLETAYTYEWSLISHPADYSGEMEHRHSQTLKLSHVSEL